MLTYLFVLAGTNSIGTPSTPGSEERPAYRHLQLKPRSKPVTPDADSAARKASIFGGGRPHDELEYEVSSLEW